MLLTGEHSLSASESLAWPVSCRCKKPVLSWQFGKHAPTRSEHLQASWAAFPPVQLCRVLRAAQVTALDSCISSHRTIITTMLHSRTCPTLQISRAGPASSCRVPAHSTVQPAVASCSSTASCIPRHPARQGCRHLGSRPQRQHRCVLPVPALQTQLCRSADSGALHRQCSTAAIDRDNASVLVCGGGGVALLAAKQLKDLGAWVWMLQRNHNRKCVLSSRLHQSSAPRAACCVIGACVLTSSSHTACTDAASANLCVNAIAMQGRDRGHGRNRRSRGCSGPCQLGQGS